VGLSWSLDLRHESIEIQTLTLLRNGSERRLARAWKDGSLSVEEARQNLI
jgi:hypothetical protein